ncbi:hypothetical protein BJ878DRAFT_508659 [Calycina marina]|uniref:Ubiquitin-like protease family profile domain-containing protein n=1 Tax=Calycina marina TaxID=1763456 RepID=A0A9P7Z1X6_9HELO|nr:hypothetical protein BJ878DRAFT_508659 [Calycina marina]
MERVSANTFKVWEWMTGFVPVTRLVAAIHYIFVPTIVFQGVQTTTVHPDGEIAVKRQQTRDGDKVVAQILERIEQLKTSKRKQKIKNIKEKITINRLYPAPDFYRPCPNSVDYTGCTTDADFARAIEEYHQSPIVIKPYARTSKVSRKMIIRTTEKDVAKRREKKEKLRMVRGITRTGSESPEDAEGPNIIPYPLCIPGSWPDLCGFGVACPESSANTMSSIVPSTTATPVATGQQPIPIMSVPCSLMRTLRSLPRNRTVELRVFRAEELDGKLRDVRDSLLEEKDLLIKSDYKTKKEEELKKSRIEEELKLREKEEKAAEEQRLADLKAAAEKKETETKAEQEVKSKRRQPLKPLIAPLSSQWEKEFEHVMIQSDAQVITVAPAGNNLHGKDLKKLRPGQWLNDEIVNAYIDHVLAAANEKDAGERAARGEEPTKIKQYISQNSFFYPNLLKNKAKSTIRLMKRMKIEGQALLKVDTMYVPVCEDSHWMLGAVRPGARTIEFFDSFGSVSKAARFVAEMKEFLKVHLGAAYVDEEWKVPGTGCARQRNGYDCGVFVCTNALCVAMGLDTTCYREEDLNQQRRNIAAVLMNNGFKGDFALGHL